MHARIYAHTHTPENEDDELQFATRVPCVHVLAGHVLFVVLDTQLSGSLLLCVLPPAFSEKVIITNAVCEFMRIHILRFRVYKTFEQGR